MPKILRNKRKFFVYNSPVKSSRRISKVISFDEIVVDDTIIKLNQDEVEIYDWDFSVLKEDIESIPYIVKSIFN